MGEIQRLACSEVGLDFRPQLHLRGIGKQHAYDCTLLGSFLDGEQRLARHPSVGHSLVVCFALTLAYDDIEPIVTQVASLTGTLYAIAQHCNRLVFQNLTSLLQRKLLAGHYILNDTAKIHFCHFLFSVFMRLMPRP